jgi:hypothetical protein
MNVDFTMLTEKYPFLSIGRYAKNEYVGIIQNSSKSIVSMYDYTLIKDENLKKLFLELADEYWWSSNRQICIDIFLRGEFDIFKPYLLSFNAKEFELIHGPSVSLGNMSKKRIKRKVIQLVRKV